MIFLKCKIRFIYVGSNYKRKKWGKKMSGNFAIKGGGGGGGPLRENAILNFHFDFLHPSLTVVLFQKLHNCWDLGIFSDHYKCSSQGYPALCTMILITWNGSDKIWD